LAYVAKLHKRVICSNNINTIDCITSCYKTGVSFIDFFFTVQPFIVNSSELNMRTLNYAVICLCCTGSTKSFLQMADSYRL